MRGSSMGGGGGNFSGDYGNTYGLSPQFLSSLGIDQVNKAKAFRQYAFRQCSFFEQQFQLNLELEILGSS